MLTKSYIFLNKQYIIGKKIVVLLILLLPSKIFAQESIKTEHFIMHHVVDAHIWHFATIGHWNITLPLPIIVYSKIQGLTVFFF